MTDPQPLPPPASGPFRVSVRDLVLMGLFAGLMAALGLLPKIALPLGVPITAQSMGVMLAGAILGPKRGAGALLLFVALVLLGLPLLAGGRGGLGIVAGPTGGFFLGFPVAAFAVGWLMDRFARPTSVPVSILACALGGIGVLYALGIPYWILVTGSPVSGVLATAVTFLPGDVIKAALAGSAAVLVHRAMPGLIAR